MEDRITIPIKEYNELLEIKRRYEELKKIQYNDYIARNKDKKTIELYTVDWRGRI